MKLREIAKEFFGTTEKQMHDEWREVKAFLGGCFVASVVWVMLWVSIRC